MKILIEFETEEQLDAARRAIGRLRQGDMDSPEMARGISLLWRQLTNNEEHDCFKQVLGVVDAIQVSESVGVQLNLLGAIRHHGRGGEPPGLDGAGVENVEFIEELGRVLTQVGILGATAQLVNHLFDDFMRCPKVMCNVPLCLDRAQSA